MSIGEVIICQPSVYLSSYDWRVLARRMMNEGMQIADGPVLLYYEYMTWVPLFNIHERIVCQNARI